MIATNRKKLFSVGPSLLWKNSGQVFTGPGL